MSNEILPDGDDLVIYISGVLTFCQHKDGEALFRRISLALNNKKFIRVRINCAEARRVDSHWLGLLVRISRSVSLQHVQCVIEKPSIDIQRLLNIPELSDFAEIMA